MSASPIVLPIVLLGMFKNWHNSVSFVGVEDIFPGLFFVFWLHCDTKFLFVVKYISLFLCSFWVDIILRTPFDYKTMYSYLFCYLWFYFFEFIFLIQPEFYLIVFLLFCFGSPEDRTWLFIFSYIIISPVVLLALFYFLNITTFSPLSLKKGEQSFTWSLYQLFYFLSYNRSLQHLSVLINTAPGEAVTGEGI